LKLVIDRKHPDYLKLWRERSQKYTMFSGAKCRAKRKGIEFSIKLEDLEFPEVCPILGIPLKKNLGSGFHADSASLDRIDPKKGYTKDNIRIISNRANLLKSDATVEELEKILLDATCNRYRG